MEVNNLVIYDAWYSHVLDKIDDLLFRYYFYKKLPYDIISFPGVQEILAEKEPSPLKIFLIEQIQNILLLRPQISSITFVCNYKEQNWERIIRSEVCASVFDYLKILFSERCLKLHVLNLYQEMAKPTLSDMTLRIMCSDARLRRIYLDLQAQDGLNRFSDICICLPGSTLAIRKSLHAKTVIKYILEFCQANGIKKIIFEHHGPDCRAYMHMKCLDSSNSVFSRKDHTEHVGKAANRFGEIRTNYFPEGFSLSCQRFYTQLDFKNNRVGIMNVSRPKEIKWYDYNLGQFK